VASSSSASGAVKSSKVVIVTGKKSSSAGPYSCHWVPLSSTRGEMIFRWRAGLVAQAVTPQSWRRRTTGWTVDVGLPDTYSTALRMSQDLVDHDDRVAKQR